MYARILCSCLWIQSVLKLACCNLHSKFKDFEELSPDNFTVLVKRHATSGQVYFKIVTFFALRKYFVLHLVPGSPVLREDFEVNMVDSNGRMTQVAIDQQIFYTGYLHGNRQHTVDALHKDGIWIAQIKGPDDEYSIEPLTHHEPDSSVTSMLIFRQRDIKSSILLNSSDDNPAFQPFCEELHFKQYLIPHLKRVKKHHPNNKNSLRETIPNETAKRKNEKNLDTSITNNIFTEHLNSEENSPKDALLKIQFTDNHSRSRRSQSVRQTRVQDTCEMLAVADFETYKGIGRRSIYWIVTILVFLYQTVDRLYRDTFFDTFTNLGIVLVKVMVHTEYTPVEPDKRHYNMASNIMNAISTLKAMANVSNFSNFCLVHLTTQRLFSGTLGVAATADGTKWSNGICAKVTNESRNIGLSTPITDTGYPMPLIMYSLVIAHEIGHNWGSRHDTSKDPNCSPSSREGGKYIMWPYSGYISTFNAKKFSPCSRKQIATVLRVKAHLCFMPRRSAEHICGNGIVDPGEDCDVGFGISDPCCTSQCRFIDQAVCTAANHPCCDSSCQIAPQTQKCFFDVEDCREAAFCSGTDSHSCPESKLLPNNSTCQSLGKCWHGNCVTFCELLGKSFTPARRLMECTCDEDLVAMCYHCCWDPESGQGCVKMGPPKRNGTPCMLGSCENGVCLHVNRSVDFLFEEKVDFSSKSNQIHQLMHLDAAVLTFAAVCLGLLSMII
ncbi:hypothetical protein BsWGS_17607 [Bradybaena similaris]